MPSPSGELRSHVQRRTRAGARALAWLVQDQGWLLILASAVSVTYALWLLSIAGDRLSSLLSGDLNHLGDFLAGSASPLAFMWLVVGYYLQRRELTLQRQQLDEQKKETAKLAAATEQIKDFDARDLSFRLLELGVEELNKLSHEIFQQWFHEHATQPRYYHDSVGGLRSQFDRGDRDVFCRVMVDHLRDPSFANRYILDDRLRREPAIRAQLSRYVALYGEVTNQLAGLGQLGSVKLFLSSQSRLNDQLSTELLQHDHWANSTKLEVAQV